MCGNTNRCCLGSPATQAGILQGNWLKQRVIAKLFNQ